MTKRRLVWVTVAVCLALAAGLSARGTIRPNRVTWENYERLQGGMTEEAVEELLGGPVGRWCGMISFSGGGAFLPSKVWNTGEHEIQVTFREGRLVHKDFLTFARPTWFERLRTRLGW